MAKSFQHGTANRPSSWYDQYREILGTTAQKLAAEEIDDRRYYSALMVELRRLVGWDEAGNIARVAERSYQTANGKLPPIAWMVERISEAITAKRRELLIEADPLNEFMIPATDDEPEDDYTAWVNQTEAMRHGG